MSFVLLYLHILLATVWIGGMITLIGFIIYARPRKSTFFYQFTTYYGWLNVFILASLILSGIGLVFAKGLYLGLFEDSELSYLLWAKIILAFIGIIATAIHSVVVLQVKKRTKLENILSKISSFYLLISSFFILYFAMRLRDLL